MPVEKRLPFGASGVVIVPIKPFDSAKTRMAGAIGPAQRAEIAERLARGVLGAVRNAGVPLMVVTTDSKVRIIAADFGAEIVDEPTVGGLNAAVDLGLETAAARGMATALILHADLPHIQASDVAAALIRPGPDGVTIAPSEDDEGTNAMSLPVPSPISLAYGAGSFPIHSKAVLDAGLALRVIRRTGLAIDADRPDDLAT